jgi:pimeloyl-ACP methyl ester carboxylesterase
VQLIGLVRLLWRTDRYELRHDVALEQLDRMLRVRPDLSVWRIRDHLLVRCRSGWGGSPPIPVAVFRPLPQRDGMVATVRVPRYRAVAWGIAPVVLFGGAIGGLFNWWSGTEDPTNFVTSSILFLVFTAVIAAALRTARSTSRH